MKPSARVALIVALAATTAPTWASLPFYSPDYTFDSTTGTGFDYFYGLGGLINPEGRAVTRIRYYESNVGLNYVSPVWRGPTPLPTPHEDNEHQNPNVSSINRHGWMCGFAMGPTPGQPAVWKPDGTRIDLPVLPASFPVTAYPQDMNDAGFVVGYAYNDQFGFSWDHPVYWTPSFEIVELPDPFELPGQFWIGEARSISSNGIIAGYVAGGGHAWRAMRWDIDGTAPILSMTTDTGITFGLTEAFRSLDDGTILGSGRIGSTDYGILWTPDGDAIELRNLPNSTAQDVGVYKINNHHNSIGRARNSSGQNVAVRWSSTGEPVALDQFPDATSNASDGAFDINDFNFAVGRSYASGTYDRAVLWTPDGDPVDINSLVGLDDRWDLISALSITNTGWISGAGNFDPDGLPESYRRPFSILVPFAGTYGMGDANFDESIDFADLLIVAQNYGTSTNGSFDVGDFNLDGSVNFTDLLAIAQNYGNVLGDATGLLPNSPNPTFESDWQAARGMVPEPNLIGGLIGLGMILRRVPRLIS